MNKILELLKEAEEGKGAYNRDPLIHADNTIKEMKKLIGQAIKRLEDLNSASKICVCGCEEDRHLDGEECGECGRCKEFEENDNPRNN